MAGVELATCRSSNVLPLHHRSDSVFLFPKTSVGLYIHALFGKAALVSLGNNYCTTCVVLSTPLVRTICHSLGKAGCRFARQGEQSKYAFNLMPAAYPRWSNYHWGRPAISVTRRRRQHSQTDNWSWTVQQISNRFSIHYRRRVNGRIAQTAWLSRIQISDY